jgi:hypothetical protein
MNELWLLTTSTAYMVAEQKGQERMKYRYVDEIARSLLEHFPNSAHLHALERLNTVGELQTDMWRQVLDQLDKLEAQNGVLDKHNSRRDKEQRRPRQDSSGEDGGETWRPSAPSGVDESAP